MDGLTWNHPAHGTYEADEAAVIRAERYGRERLVTAVTEVYEGIPVAESAHWHEDSYTERYWETFPTAVLAIIAAAAKALGEAPVEEFPTNEETSGFWHVVTQTSFVGDKGFADWAVEAPSHALAKKRAKEVTGAFLSSATVHPISNYGMRFYPESRRIRRSAPTLAARDRYEHDMND